MSLFDGVKRLFGGGSKSVAAIMPSWAGGTPMYSGGGFDNILNSGWRANELIYACVSKTAKTASQVRIVVKDKAGKELPDHPLAKLLATPNPEMSEYDLWSSAIMMTLLAGRAYYEVELDRGGTPARLWPLRPDWVKLALKDAVTLDHYEYRTPEGALAVLAPEQVLNFHAYDPAGLFSSWPPAAVAMHSADVDSDATNLIRTIFQEGGMPMGMLKTKQRLTDAQVTEIRARWHERYSGWHNWFDPAVLDADADYQRMGLTFEELGFPSLDERTEIRICMVFDVPPIIVGTRAGLAHATYSNYEQARKAWWQDGLMPRYADMLDVVRTQLIPLFPDRNNLVVEWDFSGVPAMQEMQTEVWTRALAAFAGGGITLNEYRDAIGMPSRGPSGDIFIRPATQIETKVAGESKSIFAEREREQIEREMAKDLADYYAKLQRDIIAEVDHHGG